MYGVATTPCNAEEYVANVQAGDGYYLDPGVNGGWCKTIPAANVETVREDIGTGNWQSHATGVTYLPRSAQLANVALHKPVLADSTYGPAEGSCGLKDGASRRGR